jgi:hypothetical protein
MKNFMAGVAVGALGMFGVFALLANAPSPSVVAISGSPMVGELHPRENVTLYVGSSQMGPWPSVIPDQAHADGRYDAHMPIVGSTGGPTNADVAGPPPVGITLLPSTPSRVMAVCDSFSKEALDQLRDIAK